VALEPLHCSGRSHTPADARHIVPADYKLFESVMNVFLHNKTNKKKPTFLMSLGHVLLLPLHISGSSHTPAAARHTAPANALLSLGHALFVPSHCSATSHNPYIKQPINSFNFNFNTKTTTDHRCTTNGCRWRFVVGTSGIGTVTLIGNVTNASRCTTLFFIISMFL
jgi:hypothetical protein